MEFERIVRDWQRPIYNLAYRMLGNEADASDATQEIFTAIFHNLHRYDSNQEFRPWIYTLAHRRLCNVLRDSKLRQEKEKRVAMNPETSFEENGLEKKEVEAAVHQELLRLPAESRAALVLLYYQGLSQIEAAAVLEIPRTTLQSRAEKGLESMKKGLASTGMLGAVPHLESILQSSAALSVPSSLQASLLTLAAQAGAGGVASGITIGGILMTQKIIVGSVLLGVVSLGVGLIAGKTLLSTSAGQSSKDTAIQAIGEEEYAKLKADHDALSAKLKTSQDEIARLEAESATRLRVKTETIPAVVSDIPTEKNAEPAASTNTPTTIDWGKLAALCGETFKAMGPLLSMPESDWPEPTDEQKLKMQAFRDEFSKAAMAAREISPAPFFDEKIFPELTKALLGKPLGLNEKQMEDLGHVSNSLASEIGRGFDATKSLPIEAWDRRQKMLAGLHQSLGNALSGEQRDRWNQMQEPLRRFLEGDQAKYDLPFGDGGEEKPADTLTKEWAKTYGLDTAQKSYIRDIAESYAREGKQLLKDFGQDGVNAKSLSAEDNLRLQQAFRDLQIAKEKEFSHLLSPSQLETARKRAPAIFQFNNGGNRSTSISRGGPNF